MIAFLNCRCYNIAVIIFTSKLPFAGDKSFVSLRDIDNDVGPLL